MRYPIGISHHRIYTGHNCFSRTYRNISNKYHLIKEEDSLFSINCAVLQRMDLFIEIYSWLYKGNFSWLIESWLRIPEFIVLENKIILISSCQTLCFHIYIYMEIPSEFPNWVIETWNSEILSDLLRQRFRRLRKSIKDWVNSHGHVISLFLLFPKTIFFH